MWHCRHTILGESYTQVLLDGIDKHVIGAEHRASILEDGQEKLEGQDLAAKLMGSEEKIKKKILQSFKLSYTDIKIKNYLHKANTR